ncbi:MAG: hypothetical protein JMDDDDMK_00159 [Acidobacteria bacterium]|nr:hypothetical protein [Acidobacteriota bacterium]
MSMRQAATQFSVKQLLSAVKQLPDDERREFERRFKEWKSGEGREASGKIGTKRFQSEEDLLARIRLNSRLPDTAARRFNRLRRKFQDETITESELTEYQELISRLEWMAVERLEALIELAQMRGADVKTLMREMGLQKKRNVF